MKGIDIVVYGNIGYMLVFMVQLGNLVVCGDVGDVLGDLLYEVWFFVCGLVKLLGVDCIEKEMCFEYLQIFVDLLLCVESDVKFEDFKCYGLVCKFYNFYVDYVGVY